MRAHRRATVMAIAAGAVLAASGPSHALDDDVPKQQPVLVWEARVPCDSDAALAAAGDEGRHCVLAFANDVVYLHEHAGRRAAGGAFRLSAYDIATGVPRWSQETGETYDIELTDDAVILSDKAHVEVYDPDSGALRFTRDGGLIEHNEYGVLVINSRTDVVTAVDAADGAELWTMPGRVGAMCRDFVAVVPARGEAAAPFALVDHRTGRVRWESTMAFDPATSHMACSRAPWLYVTDGRTLYELDSLDGWTTWETAVAEAVGLDLYREVALVRTGANGETTTAVRREDGVELWRASTDSLGTSLSWIGRLREDATGLFTLHPLTGETVQRVELGSGGSPPWVVAGVSDTRVVVARGPVVASYGMNDLGVAWQLDVGAAPDDVGVARGYLVVRSGELLRGYAAPSRSGR